MTPAAGRVHSFDVFDTCLVRDVASGADILTAAARSTVPSGGDVEERVGEAVRLRLLGEVRACTDGRDAALLPEIYATVAVELRGLGIDPDRMLEAEVELERASLRPVARVAARIARLHSAGHSVLFISDMHLDPDFLMGLLRERGLAVDGDRLYVSGAAGRSKLTGRLYDHVLRKEGLSPEQLVHTGDDDYVDRVMALTRGITATPFAEGRLNRYERRIAAGGAAPPSGRSRAAGVARAARLAEASEDPVAMSSAAVGAGVVGPLFCGYVRWVLDDARRRGVTDLCFVARDGQVLHEIAVRIRRPDDPACHYVYGSRQAWFLPAVGRGTVEDVAWIFEPRHERADVRSVLAKLDISPEEVQADLASVGLAADSQVTGDDRAVAALLTRIRPVVVARAARARDMLSRYLRQEGLLDGTSWAVVDIGWYLNAQAALRSALGADAAPGGYYLGVRQGRRALADTGWFRALVREDSPGGRRVLHAGWVLDNLNLVEHVMAKADHGGCLGYEEVDGRILPRLAPARPVPEWFRPLRAAVLRYATAAEQSGLLDDGGAAAFAAGDVAGRLLAEQPTPEEAVLFGATLVSDDQNESRLRRLAAPYDWGDLRWRVARKVRRLDDDPFRWRHWEAGTWAATPITVRAVLSAGPHVASAARRPLRVLREVAARRRR